MYLGTVYKLTYPTVDDITDHLRKLGKQAKIYKIDLSRAFRQLPVDPHDYDLLCLKWKNSYFSDLFTPFGHVGGSLSCCRLTSFFRYLAHKNGYVTYCYVDDVIGLGLNPTATEGFHYMKNLLEELNFPISSSKLVEPSIEVTCLGIVINARRQTVSIPTDKHAEIIKKCKEIIQSTSVTKRAFQSLLGSLMFVHKCVKSSRVFTNRLLHCLRQSTSDFIDISTDVVKDIKWFLEFMPRFNGTATYVHHSPSLAETIAIDASLKKLGGVWGREVYSIDIPNDIKLQGNITHFEMMNIVIALRVWKEAWRHKHVHFGVDTEAVVIIYNSGYTRDSLLVSFARNIWLISSIYDIKLTVSHIAGKKNKTADLLSRWEDTEQNYDYLANLVPHFIWKDVTPEIFYINNDI